MYTIKQFFEKSYPPLNATFCTLTLPDARQSKNAGKRQLRLVHTQIENAAAAY
jgi:hypothetical protein